jgi:hypothetical protein
MGVTMPFMSKKDAIQARATITNYLLRAEREGRDIRLSDAVFETGRSNGFIWHVHRDLLSAGILRQPLFIRDRPRRARARLPSEDEITARIAAVREAKVEHWQKTGVIVLDKRRLREVLPS